MPQPATKLDDDTPMMRQYQSIKRQCADAILFFRMGDFYEMFNDDAKVAAGILDIALTSRAKNKANPIPMCGVPHHAASAYISRLIQAGKKVAICEQMEDPKLTKGLVKRGIVRVVTPGTVIDDTLLDPKSNHFLAALHYGRGGMGLRIVPVAVGGDGAGGSRYVHRVVPRHRGGGRKRRRPPCRRT